MSLAFTPLRAVAHLLALGGFYARSPSPRREIHGGVPTRPRRRKGGQGPYGERPYAYIRDTHRRKVRRDVTPDALKATREKHQQIARERRKAVAIVKNRARHDAAVVSVARAALETR